MSMQKFNENNWELSTIEASIINPEQSENIK
jgi:hypothetical protein